MSHPSVIENSKTKRYSKKRNSDWTEQKNNDVEYTWLRNEIIETIEETEAIRNWSYEWTWKTNKSKNGEVTRKIYQFCKRGCSRILWWFELGKNHVITMLYACAEPVES